MANDLSPTPPFREDGPDVPEALSLEYSLDDFEGAINFLQAVKHDENVPWAYLRENLVVVLQKLSLIRHYLLNPGDQQRLGVHSFAEIFLCNFPQGIKIGHKVIASGAALDTAIMDLCEMGGYQIPHVEIPTYIKVLMKPEGAEVIDLNDTF